MSSMQWFRMYSEFATDPKVQMLSEADQRRFIMLLCMRCGNDAVTFHDDEIAFQLRISNEDWLATKAVLQSKGLIDGECQPVAWNKRQYVSDTSTARVRAHRARKKQQVKQDCNVSVTPPDTDTDISLSARDAQPPAVAETPKPQPVVDGQRFAMPDDWQPNPDLLRTLLRTQTSAQPDDVTPELIDKYRLWCIGQGGYQNERGWHAGLLRWAINERPAAKVVPMRQAASGPDFNDTSWADDLGVM